MNDELRANIPPHPLYLAASYYLINSKKIVIGLNSAFEIKILICAYGGLKPNFVELNKLTFIELMTIFDEISSNYEIHRKKKYRVNDEFLVKIFKVNQQTRILLKDISRDRNIYFHKNELEKFISHKVLLNLTINKLNINQAGIINLYNNYIRIAREKNCTNLTIFEATSINSIENSILLDHQKIFLEFYLIFGEHKILKDIEMLNLMLNFE